MSLTHEQDHMLQELAIDKTLVSVYLVNGIRLQGVIEDQDRYTLLLNHLGVSQLVYKHAITTILSSSAVPERKEKE